MVLEDNQVKFIKKLIYDATLSEEWLKEVEIQLEANKERKRSHRYFTDSSAQNSEKEVKVLNIERSMYETNPPEWKIFNVSDRNQSLDPYLKTQSIDFNISMMTLFAHIGIRSSKTSSSKDEKFSIQPVCQPHVNN
jgi:hypothetical protein